MDYEPRHERAEQGQGAEHASNHHAHRTHTRRGNLEFFVANLLPNAVALGKSITSDDESCLDPALFE